MKKRGWEDKRLLAAFLTIVILGVLVFSGPAQAITLGLSRIGSGNPSEGDTLTFSGKVDLHTTDAINLQAITVLIDPTPTDSLVNAYRCKFYLNGSAFSDNNAICDISITNISSDYASLGEGYGDAYGYAYKFSTEVTNTSNFTFNNGYTYGYKSGYGYDSYNTALGSTSEIVMNFTWTTPSVSGDTTYKVGLGALAGTDAEDDQVLFLSEDSIEVTVQNAGGGGSATTTIADSSSPSPGVYTGPTTVVEFESEVLPNIEIETNAPIIDATIEVEEVSEITVLEPNEAGFAIATPVQAGTVQAVYKYIKITPSADIKSKVTRAKIDFTVDKVWLEENGLDITDIVLLRLVDGEWVALPTSYLGSSDGNFNFQSSSPGFSLFAVGVRKAPEVLTPPPVTTPEPAEPITGQVTEPITEPVCQDVLTFAVEPGTGDCYEFDSGCDVPAGWTNVESCDDAATPPTVVTGSMSANENLAVFLGLVVIVLMVLWLFVYRKPKAEEIVFHTSIKETTKKATLKKAKKTKKPVKKRPHMFSF